MGFLSHKMFYIQQLSPSDGVEKKIELLPDWLVDLTPNWLKRLLQSSTFWLWTWSISSLIIVSLIISN